MSTENKNENIELNLSILIKKTVLMKISLNKIMVPDLWTLIYVSRRKTRKYNYRPIFIHVLTIIQRTNNKFPSNENFYKLIHKKIIFR